MTESENGAIRGGGIFARSTVLGRDASDADRRFDRDGDR